MHPQKGFLKSVSDIQNINPSVEFAERCADARNGTPVTRPFELVEPGPVPSQILRLEYLYVDGSAVGIQHQARKA